MGKLAAGYNYLLGSAYNGDTIFHTLFRGWWKIVPDPSFDLTSGSNQYLAGIVIVFVFALLQFTGDRTSRRELIDAQHKARKKKLEQSFMDNDE